MILHSIRIGERQIHVRTDDCDQRELERVHEAVRLVDRMLNRHGFQAYGLLMGLVMFFGSMGITLSTMSPGPVQVIIPMVAFVSASAVTWQLLAGNVRQRQLADAARLQALTMASTRCRDFVLECTEASPVVLNHFLSNLAPRPQTA